MTSTWHDEIVVIVVLYITSLFSVTKTYRTVSTED